MTNGQTDDDIKSTQNRATQYKFKNEEIYALLCE